MANPTSLTIPIRLTILPAMAANVNTFNIRVNVLPAQVQQQTLELKYPFLFNIKPIEINLSDAIINTSYQFLSQILEDFVDEDRDLKTLLNFGEDRQNVVISRRFGPIDATGTRTIQLKLLQPIPDDISSNEEGTPTTAFISTEIAQSIIQKARFIDAPPIDRTPYLRPMNTGITVGDQIGKSLNNVTLNILQLESGSIGTLDQSNNVSFEDSIFRQWYSYDFNSSELNIDFTDYNKFVFYGSAAMRLYAFRQKLLRLEKLENDRVQFQGDVFTGELASAAASYITETSANLSRELEDLIRSFDRYEQHLYFTPSGSDLPYSASAFYAESGGEFNEISYWPKQSNGNLYPVDSVKATEWFEQQVEIAQRYDEFNENNLINTIPTHIREDDENAPYFTFVVMIGHFFDTIKPYIDQFPQIYSRYTDPNEELSKDLVTTIAESVGFKMPTIDSVYSLTETILGTTDAIPRRDFTVEAHKRLLHNLPLFAKTKGSRYALRSVLRTLGITEQLIDIQEAGVSDENSVKVFSEFYTALKFENVGQYIKIPLSSSQRTPAARSLQVNLIVSENKDMTVLSGDEDWSLNVKSHPTNPKLIKFELVDLSDNVLISTKYFDNSSKDLINISLRTYENNSETKLRITKTYQEDIIFYNERSDSGEFISLWNSTDDLYIGGFGTAVVDNFVGIVDEFRLWGLNLSDKSTENAAFDPGTNAGDIYTDASDFLYAQISLNKVDKTLFTTNSRIINESPYKEAAEAPSMETFEVSGFSNDSFVREKRYVRQLLPNIGSISYITNKVRVAPPPEFIDSRISPTGTKRLSRTRSIVSLKDKIGPLGTNKINLGNSPTTIINQNIIRNIGLENINEAYGIPNDSYKTLPSKFEDLVEHYNKYYYVNVDQNRFIRVMANASSIVRQIVDYFIPSRATALVGIVIEPNVLERNKIPLVKKLKFYGIGSRRTTNVLSDPSQFRKDYEATFTLTDTISAAEIASGSYDTQDIRIDDERIYDPTGLSSALDSKTADSISTVSALTAKFDEVTETLNGNLSNFNMNIEDLQREVGGEFKLIDIQHPTWDVTEVLRIFNRPNDRTDLDYIFNKDLIRKFPGRFVIKKLAIKSGLDKLNKVGFSLGSGPRYGLVGIGKDGAEPYGRIYPRKLFEYEIARPRVGGITSLTRRGLYAIPPSCDLDDVVSRTFFIQPFSVYYFPKKIRKPIYPNELNAVWNMDDQKFEDDIAEVSEDKIVNEWTFGQRYNENDVVVQNVQFSSEYTDSLSESIISDAISGNAKFYVFKTKSSIQPDEYDTIDQLEKTPFYTNGVPSTMPPSLDRENWARLRFTPTIIRQPRRVVYDSFIIQDPELNDFKTTTVDISRRIDLPERFIDLFTIGNVPKNSRTTGQITVQKIATLFAAQLNSQTPFNLNLRLRLYRSVEDRNADVNRPLYQTPDVDAGVLLDMNFTDLNSAKVINPVVSLISGTSTSSDGILYYTIDNLTSNQSGFVSLYLYYYALQVEPRLPLGYLRKHYRYFRDNSTATKRRNYLGCKNTRETTIDGGPPVEIFLSEGNESTVSSGLQNNEVRFGGGGTLDV